VGALTCPCSPGVVAWHGSTRTAESDRPRVRDPHKQDSESRTRDLHDDIGGATMRYTLQKEMLQRVHRLADSRPLSGD